MAPEEGVLTVSDSMKPS